MVSTLLTEIAVEHLYWQQLVFIYNCLHDLISFLFIFTVEDIKSRTQEKHVSYVQTLV